MSAGSFDVVGRRWTPEEVREREIHALGVLLRNAREARRLYDIELMKFVNKYPDRFSVMDAIEERVSR